MNNEKAESAAKEGRKPEARGNGGDGGSTVEYANGQQKISLPQEKASFRILHAEMQRLQDRLEQVIADGRDEDGELGDIQEERAQAALRNLKAMKLTSYCNQTLLAYRFSDD